jgi:hypothetical protein
MFAVISTLVLKSVENQKYYRSRKGKPTSGLDKYIYIFIYLYLYLYLFIYMCVRVCV